MSINTKHKTYIMPKIHQSSIIEKRNINKRKSYTRKENFNEEIEYANKKEVLDNEKKPSTSIDRKKPKYIFPKINPTKAPPSTANYGSSGDPLSVHAFSKKTEFDKDENIKNNNNNKINYNNGVYNIINIAKTQAPIQINKNDYDNEKQLTNNKVSIDLNKYKDISINFLINNSELSQMFETLYKKDNNVKKKWVELNLFGREVFKIRLESYIKNKTDIPSFIKKEIETLLSNQYYDYIFSKSCKEIQNQYDDYIKNIDSVYE